MTRPSRGAVILLAIALAGCAAPMNARLAQGYATRGLNRYCAEAKTCSSFRFVAAQHLKSGWLVDFESAGKKYGVMVHEDRNTDVTVWAKDAAAP